MLHIYMPESREGPRSRWVREADEVRKAREDLEKAEGLRAKLEAMPDEEYAQNVKSPTKKEMLKKLNSDMEKLRKKLE